MTERLRNIVIALALAGLAALLVGLYVTSYQRHVQRGEEHVSVFVAAKDIPAGTSGADALRHGMLSPRSVVRRAVVPGAIANTAQISGLVAAQPIYAGEQITDRRFSQSTVQGVYGQIKGTERAYQFQGDGNQLLAGTVRDGDHVDLIATYRYHLATNSGQTYAATRTVLRDLRVLRAPASNGVSGKVTNNFADHYSVMLAVTDAQAQKLNFTLAQGSNQSWSLTLRPPLKAADSPESVTTLDNVLIDGMTSQQIFRLVGKYQGGQ